MNSQSTIGGPSFSDRYEFSCSARDVELQSTSSTLASPSTSGSLLLANPAGMNESCTGSSQKDDDNEVTMSDLTESTNFLSRTVVTMSDIMTVQSETHSSLQQQLLHGHPGESNDHRLNEENDVNPSLVLPFDENDIVTIQTPPADFGISDNNAVRFMPQSTPNLPSLMPSERAEDEGFSPSRPLPSERIVGDSTPSHIGRNEKHSNSLISSSRGALSRSSAEDGISELTMSNILVEDNNDSMTSHTNASAVPSVTMSLVPPPPFKSQVRGPSASFVRNGPRASALIHVSSLSRRYSENIDGAENHHTEAVLELRGQNANAEVEMSVLTPEDFTETSASRTSSRGAQSPRPSNLGGIIRSTYKRRQGENPANQNDQPQRSPCAERVYVNSGRNTPLHVDNFVPSSDYVDFYDSTREIDHVRDNENISSNQDHQQASSHISGDLTYLAEAEAVEPYVVAVEVVTINKDFGSSSNSAGQVHVGENTNSRDLASSDAVEDGVAGIVVTRKDLQVQFLFRNRKKIVFVLTFPAILVLCIILTVIFVISKQYDGDDTIPTPAPTNVRKPIRDTLTLYLLVDKYIESLEKDGASVDAGLATTSTQRSIYDEEYGKIEYWDVSTITNFTELFSWRRKGELVFNFTADLSRWDVSSAISMRWMFHNSSIFQSDLSRWDVSSVSDMTTMFYNARSFQSDLSRWQVGNAVYLESLFSKAFVFTSDLSQWNVSQNCEKMQFMFFNATSFDSDLSGWDVSNVKNMTRMFSGARSFVGVGLDSWTLHPDVVLSHMFCDAISFNDTYISNWNVTPWNIYCPD